MITWGCFDKATKFNGIMNTAPFIAGKRNNIEIVRSCQVIVMLFSLYDAAIKY
jgi:hypothetical protein